MGLCAGRPYSRWGFALAAHIPMALCAGRPYSDGALRRPPKFRYCCVCGVVQALPSIGSMDCTGRCRIKSQCSGLISIPIARRPRSAAALSVGPLPAIGSITKPPGFVQQSPYRAVFAEVGNILDSRTGRLPRTILATAGRVRFGSAYPRFYIRAVNGDICHYRLAFGEYEHILHLL